MSMFDDCDEQEAKRSEQTTADSGFQPTSNHASTSEASEGESDGDMAGENHAC